MDKPIENLSAKERRELLAQLLQKKMNEVRATSEEGDLTRQSEKLQHSAQGVITPPLLPSSRATPLPLSFSQRRIWFIEQLAPGQHFYNVSIAFHLLGPLHLSALTSSINEIIRRHEALRTTFMMHEGQPVQIIAPTLTLSPRLVDLQLLPETSRQAVITRLAFEESQVPLDLLRGPLLRLSLMRIAPQEHVFVLIQHHIISDAWSSRVLVREFVALYEAYLHGKPSPLPDLSVQYADFAVWQQQWLQGEPFQALLAYWKRQLAGMRPLLELPTDFPRPAVQAFRGAYVPFTLSKDTTQMLNALSRQEGVTLFMMLLAGFQVMLSRYSGQQDIVVGSIIANRTRPELEGLIGFFVNTLVLRTDLSNNPTFREILKRVRNMALEAYDHQDMPFEKLVEELHPERDLSFNPLFQVMLVFQNVPRLSTAFADLELQPLEIEENASAFDITLHLAESEQGIQGAFEYNIYLFQKRMIERMATHLQHLFSSLADHLSQRLSELPLLPEAESRQILVHWNDTRREYPQKIYLHQWVELQVESTPDAIALVCNDEHLTYREMNRRANQLAHYLRSVGVKPEALVGICRRAFAGDDCGFTGGSKGWWWVRTHRSDGPHGAHGFSVRKHQGADCLDPEASYNAASSREFHSPMPRRAR